MLIVRELLRSGILADIAEVKDRPVLVIGGGEIAARKITFLLRAEAKVHIVAETLMPELAEKVEREEIQWRATVLKSSSLMTYFW